MAFLSSGRASPTSSCISDNINPSSPPRDTRSTQPVAPSPSQENPQQQQQHPPPTQQPDCNSNISLSPPPPSSVLELPSAPSASASAAATATAAAAADTSRSTTPAATEDQAGGPLSEAHTPKTNSGSSSAQDAFILKMSPPLGKMLSEEVTSTCGWAEGSKLSQGTAANASAAARDAAAQNEDISEVSLSGNSRQSLSIASGEAAEGAAGETAKRQSLLVPCLAVFSSNYNFVVTSIALFLMNQDPVYRQTLESVVGNGTIKMLSYAGAIAGMCIMGHLGDLIGRRLAMICTLFLVAFGALGSAVFSWGSALSVTIILGVFRFVLGVGSGGVYPLSAVTAAEGSNSIKEDDRCLRVSWAYSMNVPGILFPYVLALLLWWWSSASVEVCFRVLLCFGAVPAFLVWLPAWRLKDSREYVHPNFASKLLHVFVKRAYWRQLLGTGVCWLLYDVTAYGILLVQPEITELIWGKKTVVEDVIKQNILLNAIGIPGCYMGILVLRQMGVKWLQFWGFVGLAGSAFLLAAAAHALEGCGWAQLALLAVVNFFINWGASITTFILPSVVFPPSVRSTYAGISAAMGKVGAVGGIYIMKMALANWGLCPMMICAGVPSLIAAALTFFFVSPSPQSATAALKDCFGSLGGCIPFVDCRRRRKM